MSSNAFDVRAAATGDRDAFARLIQSTQTLVRATALSILGNVERSEDVAQEVYLAAWNRLRSLRSPEKFEPWIRQIARNRAHSARLRGNAPLDAAADIADSRPMALDSLIASEDARHIEAALAGLSTSDREALVLFYRNGSSIEVAAIQLGVSETVFRKRLSRARARVREEVLRPAEESLLRPLPAFAPSVLARLPAGAPPASPHTFLPHVPVAASISLSVLIITVIALLATYSSAGSATGAGSRAENRAPGAASDTGGTLSHTASNVSRAAGSGTTLPPAVAGAILGALTSRDERPEDEGKMHLAGIFVAEKHYRDEHHSFSDDFVALDWYPGAESPRYVFGFCTGGARSHTMKAEVAAAPSEPVSMTATFALADPCDALRAAHIDASVFLAGRDSFTAFAVANLDDDPDLDVWSINERKQLVHLHADRAAP